ncbi:MULTISPECIES: GNAT family N-acetyltransferase [Halorussus]|uniref:GNAT family N-acetyltransferase n=1 Tax=Halorussus TaxID=1070314 RepID=UPI000E20FAFE|nr:MULTISPECIES: GNAT family protein [Halorussus]NHN58761.1 GNAT family N-acetyltransferase [Halorussus sp. JP-T4]
MSARRKSALRRDRPRDQARLLATNPASARTWEKLGFAEEGVHRDRAFTGGEHVDVRYFRVLESE